jgi:hypothetical protein
LSFKNYLEGQISWVTSEFIWVNDISLTSGHLDALVPLIVFHDLRAKYGSLNNSKIFLIIIFAGHLTAMKIGVGP